MFCIPFNLLYGFPVGPLFGAGGSGPFGGYAFSVPGHGPTASSGPPDAHSHAKNNFLFDNGESKYFVHLNYKIKTFLHNFYTGQ